MENTQLNTESCGSELKIRFDVFSDLHMPAFKSNEEFNRIFYVENSNKAFHLFGLEFMDVTNYKKRSKSVIFEIIDSKLWFLTKIKYGI